MTNRNPIETIEFDDAGMDRLIAGILRSGPLLLRDQELKTAEDRPSVRRLCSAVYRAVDELEDQGAHSSRIALQLLHALARYENEMAEELADQ